MYRPLFTVSVLIATVLLVLHSWLFRGPRNTMLFWVAGYLFAFGREFVYQNVFPTYRFTGADLKLFNVPVTIPMGWLFEAYTSIYLAQFMLGADVQTMTAGEARITPSAYGQRVLPVIALACVVTSTITCAIENVAVRMHWWQTGGGGYGISPGWIPGHMYTVFWLLTLLVYLMHKPLRLWRNLLYVVLALAFTAVLELPNAIGPAAQLHAWVYPLVSLVVGAYLAVLFLWRQLLLFVVVTLVFGMMGDVPSRLLASLIGVEYQRVWLVWTMSVVLLYGLYLFRTQRPERPVSPTQLL